MINIMQFCGRVMISVLITLGVIFYIKPDIFDKSEHNLEISDIVNNGAKTLPVKLQYAKASGGGANNLNAIDFAHAAEKSVHAVVHINMFSERQIYSNPFSYFFGYGKVDNKTERVKTGVGSGVIISSDGYIVTNNHVIKGSSKIEVTLNDKKTYEAEIVGKDPNTDIALIKINERDLPFLVLSDSDNLKLGEWVLAVGNPFNLTSTITAGIISAKGRNINLLGRNLNATNPIESFIQTDAVVNPGNSGGALVNIKGELIGINTAISSQTGSYVGYSFAVPSNLVKKVIEDLLEYGVVQQALLGVNIQDLTVERIKYYNNYAKENGLDLIEAEPQEGVYISSLSDNGGAIEAGLEKGDIIKKVNGKEVHTSAELIAFLGSKRPGDIVNITVVRGRSIKQYNVKLRNREGTIQHYSKESIPVKSILGGDFRKLNYKEKVYFELDYGLKVINLRRGRLLQGGIKQGDIILKVNGEKIFSESQLLNLVREKLSTGGQVYISAIDMYGQIKRVEFEFE